MRFIRYILGIEEQRKIEIDLDVYECVKFINDNPYLATIEFLEKGDYRPLAHTLYPGMSCWCIKPETVDLKSHTNITVIKTGQICLELFDCDCTEKKV